MVAAIVAIAVAVARGIGISGLTWFWRTKRVGCKCVNTKDACNSRLLHARMRVSCRLDDMATRNSVGGAIVPLSSAHSLAAPLLLLYLPLAPRLAAALPMDDQRSAETQKIQRKSDAGSAVGWFRVLPRLGCAA